MKSQSNRVNGQLPFYAYCITNDYIGSLGSGTEVTLGLWQEKPALPFLIHKYIFV